MTPHPLPVGRSRPARLAAEQLEDRSTPAFLAGAAVVVAADADAPPLVRVVDPTTQVVETQFLAYDPSFTGGVRVAVGDVTGDGYPDLVVAPGRGMAPQVKVYDGATGNVVRSFLAFDSSFLGGVYVATGDVDGDGRDEVIASAGPGGGPQVAVFDGTTGALRGTYFAYPESFHGGVRVAAGDTDGDGTDEILTVPGVDGGPAVVVEKFQPGGSVTQVASIFAYDESFRGGMYVAAGDVTGDGKAEVITGTGRGGGPAVGIYTTDGTQLMSFFAYDPSFRGGVRVAAEDLTGDGIAEIITGAGPGGGPQANIFAYGSVTPLTTITGLPADDRTGILVDGSTQQLKIPATPDAQIAAAYSQVQAAMQRARPVPQHPTSTIIYPAYPFFPFGYAVGYSNPYYYYDDYYEAVYYDSFYYDAGYVDPGFYDPGFVDPGFYDPGVVNPGYYDPGIIDVGYYDPGFSDPGSIDAGSSGDFGFDPGIIDV